jgi:hypothetical protein
MGTGPNRTSSGLRNRLQHPLAFKRFRMCVSKLITSRPVLRIRNKSFGSGFGSGLKLVSDSDPDSNPAPNPDSNLDPNSVSDLD